jgi:hypothetical protein
MSCSAPCDDITSTVPPMTPIQMLNGAASPNWRLNQCSLPACAACFITPRSRRP